MDWLAIQNRISVFWLTPAIILLAEIRAPTLAMLADAVRTKIVQPHNVAILPEMHLQDRVL